MLAWRIDSSSGVYLLRAFQFAMLSVFKCITSWSRPLFGTHRLSWNIIVRSVHYRTANCKFAHSGLRGRDPHRTPIFQQGTNPNDQMENTPKVRPLVLPQRPPLHGPDLGQRHAPARPEPNRQARAVHHEQPKDRQAVSEDMSRLLVERGGQRAHCRLPLGAEVGRGHGRVHPGLRPQGTHTLSMVGFCMIRLPSHLNTGH